MRRHRRGEQVLGNGLGQHEVERIAQRRVLRAHRGDPRGELRVVRERLVDARGARGGKASVDIRVDVGVRMIGIGFT